MRLTVAGRTDAGVHARGQVVHADVDRDAWAVVPGRSDRTPAEAARTRLGGIFVGDAEPYAALRPLLGRQLSSEPGAYLSAAGDFAVSQVVDRVSGVHGTIRKADLVELSRLRD